VAKHFRLTITDTALAFERDDAAIAREAALDGFYVLRTSLPTETLDAGATVLAYKALAPSSAPFARSRRSTWRSGRCITAAPGGVRAHVFLCLLAYHVQWHMRQALAPILFDDHDRPAAATVRVSPVAAAQISPAARAKAQARRTADGQPVHSWRTLLADLATLTRNTVRLDDAPPTTLLSTPTPTQQRAFDLLGLRLQP
jgi:hypothetical protein